MAASPDGYESQYMNGAEALVRSRRPMPWWFFALLGVALAVSVGSSIAAGTFGALITAPLLIVVGLLLSVLRVTVTRSHLHVQLGLWGPKIAIADITRITATDYPVLRYGGWGIRLGSDGSWAYSTPGGTGRGVRVEYRVDGRDKAVFVSTDEADEIVRVVSELKGGAATGVRVEAEPTAARASDEGVEAEGRASEEASNTARRDG